MIQNEEILRRFEEDLIKMEPQRTFRESLRLFEAMWKEGVTLGILPLSNPLDGLEVDIELARVLNCSKTSLPE